MRVLSESLARDAYENKNKKKSIALRETKSFIQNIHHFRDECLENEAPPLERIAIFDEAQRAWNLPKTKTFTVSLFFSKSTFSTSPLKSLNGPSIIRTISPGSNITFGLG